MRMLGQKRRNKPWKRKAKCLLKPKTLTKYEKMHESGPNIEPLFDIGIHSSADLLLLWNDRRDSPPGKVISKRKEFSSYMRSATAPSRYRSRQEG